MTAFNRRVYQSLTEKIKNLEDCSISSFNGEFSPDEVGRITGIIEKFDKLNVDSKVLEDYVSTLLAYKPKSDGGDSLSDDDFFKNMQELRKRKNS